MLLNSEFGDVFALRTSDVVVFGDVFALRTSDVVVFVGIHPAAGLIGGAFVGVLALIRVAGLRHDTIVLKKIHICSMQDCCQVLTVFSTTPNTQSV